MSRYCSVEIQLKLKVMTPLLTMRHFGNFTPIRTLTTCTLYQMPNMGKKHQLKGKDIFKMS